MTHEGRAQQQQPLPKAEAPVSKSSSDHFSTKQFSGKCFMNDAKEALVFLQQRAAHLLNSFACSAYPNNNMKGSCTRDGCAALMADLMRLVTYPLFWILLVLAGVSGTAATVACFMWVLCAPLLLRNSDFITWALAENSAKFKGKVAWVTGGSSGIGLAVCKQLATREVKGLILTGRSMSRLEKARHQILAHAKANKAKFGEDDLLLLPLDVAKGLRPELGGEEEAAAHLWDKAVQTALLWRGGVDILFNNAEDLRGCGSAGVVVTSVHPGYIDTNINQNIADPLVDPSSDRNIPVKWDQSGLDVDLAASLILRAVSRDLEEAWLAVPIGLFQMYLGFYVPQFLRFARRFTAKRECALSSEYRESVISQLTGSGTSNISKSK